MILREIWWPDKRRREGCGFVARRLVPILIARQCIVHGRAYTRVYRKFTQVLDPWDFIMEDVSWE